MIVLTVNWSLPVLFLCKEQNWLFGLYSLDEESVSVVLYEKCGLVPMI